MTETKTQPTNHTSQNDKRITLFLILAVLPLPVLFYYNPLGAIILSYSYLLLLIKQPKLQTFKPARLSQEITGIILIAASLFAYYAIILIYPEPYFYGVANYAMHITGLFIAFFDLPALKEAFTPLFLMLATTLSSFLAAGLKPILAPSALNFAHLITSILRALGINAAVTSMTTAPLITITSLTGETVNGVFTYECMGISSALIFAIILVVVLMEDPSPIKTRILYSIMGLTVTFALNILRATIIFITDYFYGAEVGATIHYIIGYVLFTTWLVCFLYIYSKRQTLHKKITSIWTKNPSHETKMPQQQSTNHPSNHALCNSKSINNIV
jgi:exosortase/archaeosortase family protein